MSGKFNCVFIHEEITKYIDENSELDVNFTKDFDKTPREVNVHAFQGKLANWIQN